VAAQLQTAAANTLIDMMRVIALDEKELSYRWRKRAFATSTMCFINSK